MKWLQSGVLENVEYPFIAITHRATLAWGGSICKCSIYGSNRTLIIYYSENYLPVQQVSKYFGDRSRGQPKSSLFNSYNTKE